MVIRADAGRVAIRVPLVLLGAAVLVCAAILIWEQRASAGSAHVAIQGGSLRVGVVCGLVFTYIRWVYVARARLVVDADGLAFRQPLSGWRIAWREVAGISQTGFLSPTHRGGVAAGVKLTLRAGGSRLIPDVLSLPRDELACLLASRLREASKN